tara:strand:- start:817 stop:1275 length:459 start_codon:yes stop_codon:yes gene_type:complete
MTIHINKYWYLIFIIIILNACKLQEPLKTHGIVFLENRSKNLTLNKSNKNDVIKDLGQPHLKSINADAQWIYIERVLTKGKYHKLGKHVLKSNNVLILDFDKYGVLKNKNLLTKKDLKEVEFSDDFTENELKKRSMTQKILQSLKSKMYGKR